MLDTATRRRIDTARDILVGKVPDPKSQVEQITIALIYKFMDDMDAESEELGGRRSFFAGDYARFGWAKLLAPSLGGQATLDLYAEAIGKMDENEGVPPLFRNIFKNAYLPYRDPETLRSFLKIIDEFSYDHSERLGDAFEYLLSVLGSQGDAGQFRTPRHIIDFMVEIIDPQKHETILDPACGTAGFLISAYKHILQRASADDQPLSPDERARLAQNVSGYDISPDMVRLSLVNLYLHGFTDPHIHEYDTLTSDERWDEYADVILANPPFMSPKGGIKPHKRFSVQSKRSEVLFVDYMAEHLRPGGRAAIIVPEGIIFQSQNAYKTLRQLLVEKYLLGVVSLPAGVFQPYSGVKTSILLLDRALAKQNHPVLFAKVEHDGFDLGAQRRPVVQNDLPATLAAIQAYQQALRSGDPVDADEFAAEFQAEHPNVLVVEREKIGENGEWNLSGERYRVAARHNFHYETVKISDVCEVNPRKSELSDLPDETTISFVPMSDLSEDGINFEPQETKQIGEVIKKGYTYFRNGDVLVAKVTPCFENGKAGLATNLESGIGFGSSEYYVLRPSPKILPEIVYHYVKSSRFRDYAIPKMTGTGGLQRVPKRVVSNFQIPLPPLDIQREIVAEIEGYQRIIDGARAVVDNYRPQIQIDPAWKIVELGEVCEFTRGPFGGSLKKEIFVEDGFAVYEQSHAISGKFAPVRYYIDEEKFQEMERFKLSPGDVIMSCSGTMGKIALVPDNVQPGIINQALLKLRAKKSISEVFLKHWMESENFQRSIANNAFGAAIKNVASVKVLSRLLIPLPDLATQQRIVAQIERERALVAANRELVELFAAKINETIGRVWVG